MIAISAIKFVKTQGNKKIHYILNVIANMILKDDFVISLLLITPSEFGTTFKHRTSFPTNKYQGKMGLKLRRLHTGSVNKTVGIKTC